MTTQNQTKVKMLEFKVPDINQVIDQSPKQPAYAAVPLKPIGGILARRGMDIAASPWGVGFEMLDRFSFDPEKTYGPLARLGVKWARIQSGWNRCEKIKGQYDFRWLDEVVDKLLKIGVTPWMSVCYGNMLYTPGARWQGVGGVPLYQGAGVRRAWICYVRALAAHFKDRIKYWEVWNEPNTTGYWPFDVQTRPEDYVELVRITAREIRAARRNAIIIGGAVSGLDFDFIPRAIRAGLLKLINKLSFHPYGQIPEPTADGIKCLRNYLDSHGGRQIGLWQGECGFVSRPGLTISKAYRSNEHIQAKYLTRRMLTDFSLGIEVSQFFHISDSHDRRKSAEPALTSVGPIGLLDCLNNYRPKRAYYAYQVICAIFDNHTAVSDAGYMELVTPDFRPQSGLVGSVRRMFTRHGHLLMAYYYPEHPSFDGAPQNIWLRFWAEGSIKNPVLIDPVFNRVYDLPEPDLKSRGVSLWEDLPMMDYPLLIADRRAVADVLRKS